MEKAIKLRVRKDLNGSQQSNIIKLKGHLISKGYTQIIHIVDLDEEFHVNTFDIPTEIVNEVEDYIQTFISNENLADSIALFR